MTKFYVDPQGTKIPVPQMGQILHVRRSNVLNDFGAEADTEVQYGNALKSALAAIVAGDKLYIGPGLMAGELFDVATSDVDLFFHGTVLEATSSSFFNYVLELNGSNVSLSGLNLSIAATVTDFAAGISVRGTDCQVTSCHVDGNHVANSGAGNGFLINTGADFAFVDRCSARRLDGGTFSQGRGLYLLSNGSTVQNFNAFDCKYIGIRCSNTKWVSLRHIRLLNMGMTNATNQNNSRSIEVDGGLGRMDYVEFDDVFCYADNPNSQAYIGFNSDEVTGRISKVDWNNVRVVNEDNITLGVSYDIPNRMQCCKFQSIDHLEVRASSMIHGDNQNASGTAYGMSFDNPARSSSFKGVTMSGGFSGNLGQRFEHMLFDHCQFGVDADDINQSILINGTPSGKVEYKDCDFNLGSTHSQVLAVNASPSTDPEDSLELRDNLFEAVNGLTVHITNDANLLSNTRRVVASGSRLRNSAAGSFLNSSDSDLNLLLTTNPNGDMIYSPTGSNMPSPPFATVPGWKGQKIINDEWDTGTSFAEWQFDGSVWLPRGGVPPAGEMIMSTSGQTMSVTLTPIPIDIMDLAEIEDRVTVTPAAAQLEVSLPGRWFFFFFANLESSKGKEEMFVEFERDGNDLDLPFRGYTRDSGESINYAIGSMADITQAELNNSGGSTVIQALIYRLGGGSETITFYNANFGCVRLH